MNNLLVIGYVWPEPASSAAGYRMLALLDAFQSEGWHVTFASPAEKSIHRVDLPSLGIDEVEIALNCSSFDDYVTQLQPDAVMFDRFMMEEQFGWRVEKACPNALRILDTEDLFTLRYARHEAFKSNGIINPPLTPELLFSEHAKREIAAILRCDLTLMISTVEIDLLTQMFKVDPALLLYCPFMLQPLTQEQQAALPTFEQRQHFLSIGNFRHAPNWDAVLYLKQQLWPLIRRQLPHAELHIYGAYPPKKATDLHHPKDGFLVKGWAEDAHSVMRLARVNLAPLRFGAGLKGKLVDAMACGTPSVTTSIGAEGMTHNASWGGAISDDPQAFARAAVALYQDSTAWQDCQQQGVSLYHRGFNFAEHAAILMTRVNQLCGGLPQHRLTNFTGAMLRHHLLKSTQYMSQWIEAKNQTPSNRDKPL